MVWPASEASTVKANIPGTCVIARSACQVVSFGLGFAVIKREAKHSVKGLCVHSGLVRCSCESAAYTTTLQNHVVLEQGHLRWGHVQHRQSM